MKYLNNGKQEKSVWTIGICSGAERVKDENGKKAHSTQKPEGLLYKVITSSSKPGDLVLDPFFGTGTTGAVAKAAGRNYVGFEREKKYIEYAKKRLNNTKTVMDDVAKLALEAKPPRVSMAKLIEVGYVRPGQKLYNKDKDKEVTVAANGRVNDGEEDLSIHKMSAKMSGLANNNGWGYFLVKNDDGEFATLDSLRYRFQEENGL